MVIVGASISKPTVVLDSSTIVSTCIAEYNSGLTKAQVVKYVSSNSSKSDVEYYVLLSAVLELVKSVIAGQQYKSRKVKINIEMDTSRTMLERIDKTVLKVLPLIPNKHARVSIETSIYNSDRMEKLKQLGYYGGSSTVIVNGKPTVVSTTVIGDNFDCENYQQLASM